MKNLFIIVFVAFVSFFCCFSQGIYKEGEVLDKFRITLKDTGNDVHHVSFTLHNGAKDEYEGPADHHQDNLFMGSYKFASIAKSTPSDVDLSGDSRPFNGRYVVEFPLYLDLSLAGEYKLTLVQPNIGVMKSIQFVDTSNPDKLMFLSVGQPISIQVDASQTGEFRDRFFLHVHAACLLKRDVVETSFDWTDPSAWYGGVPGEDDGVVIPYGKQVKIPSGQSLTIDKMYNAGEVTISNGATLKVKKTVEQKSVSNYY